MHRPVAVVRGDSTVKGTVTFEQDSESSPTTVSWDISGSDANAKRGMHIHVFGDNTNGCTSAGAHCENAPARLLAMLMSPASQPFQQGAWCPY
jgi:Cu/Zn superoxide dismutase